MHQWRKRRAAAAKKVTHHSSQPPPADDVLTGNESPQAISPDSHAPSHCSSIVSESYVRCTTAITQSGASAPLWVMAVVPVTVSSVGAPGLSAPQQVAA